MRLLTPSEITALYNGGKPLCASPAIPTSASNYAKCPCCGFATIYKGQEPPQYMDGGLLMHLRGYLRQHKQDKTARLLIQQIDVILLSR